MLNIKNVEFNDSLEIGTSNFEHMMKLRIDKLALVSRFFNEEEKLSVLNRLDKLDEREWKNYKVERKTPKRLHPYNNAVCIFSKKSGSMLVRIEYSPIAEGTGGIRFDIRPQQLSGKGVTRLLKWLGDRLGSTFFLLLARAWVTQLDVALDLYGCKLNDYVWGLHGSSVSESYENKMGLPGLRLGSPRAINSILLYEKVDAKELNKTDLVQVGKYITEKGRRKKEFFIKINEEEHAGFLRIEAKIQPESSGKGIRGQKVKGLMQDNLRSLMSPFLRLKVYSKALEGQLKNALFMHNRPDSNSVAAWVRHIREGGPKTRLSRKVKNIIEDNEIELFDKYDVWTHWDGCVAKLGDIIGNLSAALPTKAQLEVSQKYQSTKRRKRKVSLEPQRPLGRERHKVK